MLRENQFPGTFSSTKILLIFAEEDVFNSKSCFRTLWRIYKILFGNQKINSGFSYSFFGNSILEDN